MIKKGYLIILLLAIMAAGARTMFEVAYSALAHEHKAAPDADTTFLILVSLWFILMMVCDVLLLNYKTIRYHTMLIGLLTIGIFAPIIYMLVTR